VVFHPADGSGRLAHQLRADYFDMQKAGGMDQMFDGECAAWPVDFYPVAEVDTGDLQEAFTLTNSIDRPWWENRRVKCLRRDRSTSVWDLLETRAGLYRVASSGFEPFPVAGRVGAP
jgi:hypothetical protein